MRAHKMKCILFLFLNFCLIRSHLLLTTNSTQDGEMVETVANFSQLFQLWVNDIYSDSNSEAVQTLLSRPEEYQINLTNFTRLTLAASLQIDHFYRGIRRYDNSDLIKQAAGEELNYTQCLEQLEELFQRSMKQQSDGFNSTDLEIFTLMDTFGHIPDGIAFLENIWPGHYKECLKHNVNLSGGKTNFRYCSAGLRFKDWPKTRMTHFYTYHIGVCLPAACDSSSYGRKFELVEKLLKLKSVTSISNELELSNLYCLPDRSSIYMSWWLQPKTCIFLILLIFWISAQIYVTFTIRTATFKTVNNQLCHRVFKSMDIRANFLYVFETKDNERNQMTTNKADGLDLEITHGLKVICLALVMMGHFLMITSGSMKNTATFNSVEPANYLFTISNEPPAFFISIFFLVTGIMISYQIFHSQQANSIAFKPTSWFLLVLKRYLRILPIYAFIVAYGKYMAKYTSSGPYWDYGTSALSPRRVCEQESWWSTVTFTANFKPMHEACVMPSWYVACDIQFIALSPIFLTGLARHPKVTRYLIYSIMLLTNFGSSLASYFNHIPDYTSIYRINIISNGFSTIFMNEVYTRPYYRITAFLVGLLIGHYMYELKNSKQELSSTINVKTGRRWIDILRQYDKVYTALVLLNMVVLLHIGVLAKLVPFSGKIAARVVVSALFPLLLSVTAVYMGPYIILASEGRASKTLNKILSSKFWQPLSKMSLTTLICHCEVMIYIIHSIKFPIYLEFFTHLSLIILVLLSTYTVSTVLFIFIEAPLGQLLKSLVLAKLYTK